MPNGGYCAVPENIHTHYGYFLKLQIIVYICPVKVTQLHTATLLFVCERVTAIDVPWDITNDYFILETKVFNPDIKIPSQRRLII